MTCSDGIRVNIGCGKTPIEGWLNFDSSPSVWLAGIPFSTMVSGIGLASGLLRKEQAEYIRFCRENCVRYGDALRRLPLASNSCEVVYSSHVLEHLMPRDEAPRFLRETLRILAPGGRIRLAVPDLDMLVDNYLSRRDPDNFLSSLHILGQSGVTGLKRINQIVSRDRSLHRWHYNRDSLTRLLVACGFADCQSFPPGETGIPSPGSLNLRERAWESLYVEAVKP